MELCCQFLGRERWGIVTLALLLPVLLGNVAFGQGEPGVTADTFFLWHMDGTEGEDIESDTDVAAGFTLMRFTGEDADADDMLIYGPSNPFFNTDGTSAEFHNPTTGNRNGIGLFVNDEGPDTDLDLSDLEEFTLEAFVYPFDLRQSVVMRKYGGGQVYIDLRGPGEFCFSIGSDGNAVCTGEGTVQANSWYHVAATFNANEEFPMRIYLDGVLVTEGGLPDLVTDSERSLGVGSIIRDNENPPANSGQYFNGRIDEPRISVVALEPEEFLLGKPPCKVTRNLSTDFYNPGENITVTLTANNITSQTVITETIPAGITVANDGGGVVTGNEIAFTLTTTGEVSYELETEGLCVATPVAISGSYVGAEDCSADVVGATELKCVGGGGLVIVDENWEEFLDTSPPIDIADGCISNPTICETLDGRFYLYMSGSDRGLSTTYNINVTQMPAGKTRFPILFRGRTVDAGGTTWGITNESTNSYIWMNVETGGSSAEDDVGTIDGSLAGLSRVADHMTSTDLGEDGVPDRVLGTTSTTLAMQLGNNVIRIDGTGVGGDIDGDHPQVFELRIGSHEADLTGEVSLSCISSRTIEPASFAPGQTVAVTLNSRNISGATTLSETFPAGWEVISNAAGGVVDGNTITFNINSGGEISYSVRAPGDSCGEGPAAFSGSISGPGGCDGAIGGAASAFCSNALLLADLGDCGAELEAGWFLMPTCDTYFDVGSAGLSVTLATGNPDACSCRDPGAGGSGILADVESDLLFADDEAGSPGADFIITIDGLDRGQDYVLKSFHHRQGEGESVIAGVEVTGATNVDAPAEITQSEDIMANPAVISFTADGPEVSIRYLSPPAEGPAPQQVIVNGFTLEEASAGGVGQFLRADANADGNRDLSDGVFILNFLFIGGATPTCMRAADTNDSGGLDITDGSFLFNHLFLGGPQPPEPFASCAADTTADALTCDAHAACP